MGEVEPERGRPSEPPASLPGAAPLDATEPVVVLGRSSSEDPAERWLVWLRWVAILGMAATVAVADRVVAGLRVAPMAAVLGVLGVVNVGWTLFLRRTAARDGGSGEGDSEARRWVEPQLVADVIGLAAMLWF